MEEWKQVLRKLADKLPDVPLDPPDEDAEEDPELHRGESILCSFRAGIGMPIRKGPASS